MTTTSNADTIPLTLGQGIVRTPESFVPTILKTRGGGKAVTDFMKPQISDSLFLESVAKGAANGGIDYIQSTLGWQDEDGWHDTDIEVMYAQAGSGENALLIMHVVTVPKSIWDQLKHHVEVPVKAKLRLAARPDVEFGTLQDIVIEDSAYDRKRSGTASTGEAPDDPDIIGTIETTFSYSQQPKWYVSLPMTAAAGIAQLGLSKITYPQLVKPVFKSITAGFKKMWGKMRHSGTMEESWILLEEAGAAATVTEDVGEGVALKITPKGAACFGLTLALVAVQLIVSLVPHYSYHAVQIFNLSNVHDPVWRDPDLHNGIIQMAPVVGESSTDFERLVRGARTSQPNPHVKPTVTYGSASFSFVSNSAWSGLGEAFACNLYAIDPSAAATTASDYTGKTPAGFGGWGFNITFSGKNELTCGFTDTAVEPDAFWKQTQTKDFKLEAVSKALNLKLTVTYDYLEGEHPNNQGEKEYFYQSVITLEDLAA